MVAEEIRKLAEQSKSSTEEIKSIIYNIQQKSDIAVNAIKATEDVVNEQDIAVNEAREMFGNIQQSIEVMIEKVDEIKKSVIDVEKKKESTLTKIENISFISEQTAAATEEVTASTEEISSTMEELTRHSGELKFLAEELQIEISKFRTE